MYDGMLTGLFPYIHVLVCSLNVDSFFLEALMPEATNLGALLLIAALQDAVVGSMLLLFLQESWLSPVATGGLGPEQLARTSCWTSASVDQEHCCWICLA